MSDYTVDKMFADLLDNPVDQDLAAEAKSQSDFPTIKTGEYTLKASKVEWSEAAEASPWPGRLMLKLSAQAEQGGEKKGSIRFDVSPVIERTRTGRLDGPSLLFGNLVETFSLQGSSNRKVAEAALSYPVSAYVEETFIAEDSQGGKTYFTAKTEADRQAYTKQGLARRNYVRRIGEVK